MLADGCRSQWFVDPHQKMATDAIVRAWRKRGEEICQLQKAKDYYKHKTMESSNKLHMYKVMLKVAEDRNNELHVQLMQSKMNTIQIHSTKSSLTGDKEKLLHEVEFRKSENETLQALVDQRKTELSAALSEQRRLQARLSQNEVVLFKLKIRNSDLINEVTMLRSLHRGNQLKEQRMKKEFQLKSELITIMQKELSSMKERIREWNDNELKENEQQMRPLIDQVQELSRDHSALRLQTAQHSSNRNSVFQLLWPSSLDRKPNPTLEKAFPFFFKLKYILCA